MRYIDIKGLDRPVSQMVLGTSWMEPKGEELQDQIIDQYMELGGNILDTAKYYSGFKTEEYLRIWISKNPDRVKDLMFTNKACHYHVDENNRHYPEMDRVSAENIYIDIDHSLSKLGLNHIDIYMMHRDNEEVDVEEIFDALEELRLQGKIKAYGVSNWSLKRVLEGENYCRKMGYQGLSVVSPSYSLATVKSPRWPGTTYVGDDYVRECNSLGIPILSWGAQGSGIFGRHPFKGEMEESFKKAFLNDENIEKSKRLESLSREKGLSPTALAYSYIFNKGFDILGIVGPRSVDELRESMEGFRLVLSPEEVRYLELSDGHGL